MNIPSIESLLAELDKYKRAYESCDAQILSLKEQRNRLTAERDAALRDVVALTGEYMTRVGELKSALRDVKKNIETVFYGRWLDEQGPPIHKAITTINKILGEE